MLGNCGLQWGKQFSVGRESSHREGLRKTLSSEKWYVEYVLPKETALVVRWKREGRTGSLLSDCIEKEFPHRYVLRDKAYTKVNTFASNC